MILRLTIKQLAARKRRLVATSAAVVLGVGFLAGTLVLTDTIRSNVDSLLADGNEGVDAFVRAPASLEVTIGEQRPPIDAATVDRARAVPGVASVAGRISGYAQVVDGAGKAIGDQAQGAPMVAQNWVDDTRLNPFRLAEGRGPVSDDEIVVDRGTAEAGHLHVGDHVTVLTKTEPAALTIVGIARFGSADSMGGIQSVLFTDAAAQRHLGAPGAVEGVAAVAADGVSPEALAERLHAALSSAGGQPLEVVTGDVLTEEAQTALHHDFAPFNTFLLVFAGVALFVGAFIINNTFSILVAQRTRETALLRSLGASRRQVTSAVVVESVVLGGLASLAGVAGGIGMAKALKAVMDLMGFSVPAGGTVLETRTIVVSVIVGLAITVGSAVLPARRAAKVAPIAALRDVAIDHSGTSRRRLATGTLVSAAGAAAVVGGLGAGNAALVGLGAAVVFVGISALGPVLVRPLAGSLGRPVSRVRGVAGRMARENALRNPKRTAKTAAALMTGVGLVAFITIFAASVKSSIVGSIDTDYRGDYVVDSGSFDGFAGLSPELAASLRGAAGVEIISQTRVTKADVGTTSMDPLSSWDGATVAQLFDLGHVNGSLADLGADGLAVDTDLAADHGWRLGDTVAVTFVDGPRTFTVRAIYDHGSAWVGKAFVGLDATADRLDYRIYVKADDRAGIDAVAAGYPAAKVLDKGGLADQAGQEIDQLLGLIYVMLALAVVIALLGIANTMALSIHERTRELGLVRAVGMTRRQVRQSVRWESVLIAGFGTSLGLGIGTFFGWALVRAMAEQGIDRLRLPVGPLATVVLIATLAGVAATILPGRRAARLDVLTALAD